MGAEGGGGRWKGGAEGQKTAQGHTRGGGGGGGRKAIAAAGPMHALERLIAPFALARRRPAGPEVADERSGNTGGLQRRLSAPMGSLSRSSSSTSSAGCVQGCAACVRWSRFHKSLQPLGAATETADRNNMHSTTASVHVASIASAAACCRRCCRHAEASLLTDDTSAGRMQLDTTPEL